MIQCIQCKRPFLADDRIASMSGSIMGDECTDVYYLCPSCQVYTVASWRDNFTGVESMHLSGPVGKGKGRKRWRSSGDVPNHGTRNAAARRTACIFAMRSIKINTRARLMQ